MATTIWKGMITFAETRVAVKLHPAVKEERVGLHLLHRPDLVRLRQEMICAFENKPVPTAEQTKGFEVEAGTYLLVDPEELEQTVPEGSRLIEVHEFVKRAQLDPVYVDRVYSLEPETAATGYRELAAALKEMDVAGICTWTMRKRSYLGALQASGTTLRLSTLRHADEVVAVSSLELPVMPLAEKELRIGRELIQQLSVPFLPQKFVNEHAKKLEQLIAKKARGEKITVLRPRVLEATAADTLLQALEASLKKAA